MKKEETKNHSKVEVKEVMLKQDLIFSQEPTYRFEVGDAVIVGALVDPHIKEVLYDGKAYVVEYTNKKTGEKEQNTFIWHNVRPVTERMESFIKNKDVRIEFQNQTVESLLHYALFFGVDNNPDYQRGLVWSDEDKTNLIDSIFRNIDIGKFVFVELPYQSVESPGYEVLDGKQRLNAIVDYYLNKYPYKGVYYNDLSREEKYWFLQRGVAIAKVREQITEEQKLKYFLMLNTTGHVMDKEHLKRIETRIQEIQNK